MSGVLFASVVRVDDGLPLSASTDYGQDQELHETRKHLKVLSKKLQHFPDRCTFKSGSYNVNFTSALGVCYMMVCLSSYPSVLAFCFLEELQKEFIVTYDSKRIGAAIRPYSFIEFDVVIQRTKHRYNSPRSLSTKINMADMQTEIKLRPPYQLTLDDLHAINGFSSRSSANSHADVGAFDASWRRFVRPQRIVRRTQLAARRPRHRERPSERGRGLELRHRLLPGHRRLPLPVLPVCVLLGVEEREIVSGSGAGVRVQHVPVPAQEPMADFVPRGRRLLHDATNTPQAAAGQGA
ncbi:vesicle-trafficking protein SEC22a isoform X2 [Syngnathus acus]|uniref:vesicle-trafficking protein SEC22a isoform X2 n=1 Tax=Syngnathus acus TaxID=161584 RepID=UPI001885CE70|nr:vesicle-trafficking protein SEC22a isoform X2 [Syngnathus acus]XP_037096209.1 vesicle-trafficking protein SEC22a isoform X2 [Syngnathus acus]